MLHSWTKAERGKLREKNVSYNFFWKWKCAGKLRMYGVGYAIHSKCLKCFLNSP